MNKEDKFSIGRPKLAGTKLKNKSYIMLSISALLIMILLSGTLISLNILPKFNKTKGSVPIYKTYEAGEEFCLGDERDCFYVIEDKDDSVFAITKNTVSSAPGKFYNSPLGAFGYTTADIDSINNIYKNTLIENYNISNLEVRLLTYNEAISLGCLDSSCVNAPDWITNTDRYWIENEIILTKNYIGRPRGYAESVSYYRPTITIAKSDFAEIVGYEGENEEEQPNTNEDNQIYKVGDEFCLDTECFYTISDNGDTVTGLAKYNLLVGNIYNNDTEELTEIPTSTEGYGLQNEIAIGVNLQDDPQLVYGTIEFYTEEYWNNHGKFESDRKWVFDENSSLWKPVQNYQSVLRNMGYSSVTATLMSYEQGVVLGCNWDTYNCTEEHDSWLLSTTYWFGTNRSYDTMYGIVRNYGPSSGGPYYNNILGVRPVITIAKSDLLKKEESNTENLSSNTRVVTTTKKEEKTTTNKLITTKKKAAVKRWPIKTTETKKEETTTTTNVVVNNILRKKTTTKAKEEKENNVPVVPIAIGGIVAIACIGYGIYLLKKK